MASASGSLHVALRQQDPIPLDVNLTCPPGHVLALFGPSGSGKTTILRSIAGLDLPHEARITVGADVWVDTTAGIRRPPHLRRVGLVFQDYALFPHLTAIENVMAAMRHRPATERRGRAGALLTLVRLDGRAERRPSTLSGGERQRVAVARALAREPAVLLFDEPFAAVDRSLRRALHEEIDAIRATLDIPIVLVTHDFDDVVRMATDLVVINQGATAAGGTVEEVMSRLDVPWLRESVGLGSVIRAVVARTLPLRGLMELAFDGGVLLAPETGLSVGTHVRVRVAAKDVILAVNQPTGLSLQNVLPGAVTAVRPDHASNETLVQVQTGGARILAEVTADAVKRLNLVPGSRVHALVKAVTLKVLPTREHQ